MIKDIKALKAKVEAQAALMSRVQPRAHRVACKNCPSAHFPPDPECIEISTWPHELKVQTAFPCGWNQKRYCKGYCDQMGISETDLQSLENRT